MAIHYRQINNPHLLLTKAAYIQAKFYDMTYNTA